MAFNPKTEYEIVPDEMDIRDFHVYKDKCAQALCKYHNQWKDAKMEYTT